MRSGRKERTASDASTPIHIVAWPARSNADGNPFQSLLYEAVERYGDVVVKEFSVRALMRVPRPALLHVHWPDAFVEARGRSGFIPRYALLLAVVSIAKLRGVRLVWTAHNLRRQGTCGRLMNWLFWPMWFHAVNGVIFMTSASARAASSELPHRVARAVIPHGHYRPLLDAGAPRTQAATPQMMFFGGVSAYKNVSGLLSAFIALPRGSARLAIWGRTSIVIPDSEFERAYRRLPDDVARWIDRRDHFIPLEQLETKLRAVDLVVLPYAEVLNSGSALLALSAGCPILAPANGPFVELQEQVGAEWVMLFDGALDRDDLADALSRARDVGRPDRRPDLSPFDWERIASSTNDFYQRVVSAP